MNKEEIYNLLNGKNILYEITNHKAVYNMEEIKDIDIPYPLWDAKNLFVSDDKKRNYYLITLRGDKKINLNEFKKKYGLRPLSFASEEDLYKYLKLNPGSVTPLGLLNDEQRKVKFYLDLEFKNELIGVHPNDNTATVWLKTNDLVSLIKEHGSEFEFFELNNWLKYF